MRNTLVTGLLLCLPIAVLLASVSLALLAGKLRRRLQRSMNRRFPDLPVTRPDREEVRAGATSLRSASAGRLSAYSVGRAVRPGAVLPDADRVAKP